MTRDLEDILQRAETILALGRSTGADGGGKSPHNVYVILRDMTAILSALPPLVVGGGETWRPIETAPKDQTHILLFGDQQPFDMVAFRGPHVFSGYWDGIDQAWCSTASTWVGPFYTPTHWRPLPAGPGVAG